jgi:hypothetical protein
MARRPLLHTAEHPWISAAEAPLYVVTYPRERTEDDVVASHDAIAAIYQRTTGLLAWVVDASAVVGASPRERQIVAAHEERVGEIAAQRCAGLALVIPNAAVRGLLTAVRWLAPARYPQQIVGTREAAFVWVRQQLARAGGS